MPAFILVLGILCQLDVCDGVVVLYMQELTSQIAIRTPLSSTGGHWKTLEPRLTIDDTLRVSLLPCLRGTTQRWRILPTLIPTRGKPAEPIPRNRGGLPPVSAVPPQHTLPRRSSAPPPPPLRAKRAQVNSKAFVRRFRVEARESTVYD